MLYAKNAQEAERWREAFKDAAADEHRIPVDEEGLKLWLMSAASEVKETGNISPCRISVLRIRYAMSCSDSSSTTTRRRSRLVLASYGQSTVCLDVSSFIVW